MAEMCAQCEYINLNKEYKNMWGESLYYCEKCYKDVKLNNDVCSYYKPLKQEGNYTLSGCYITTIICEILGYQDNCELLVTLRNFRDNYLKNHIEYLPLLVEYDIVGPMISDALLMDKDNEKEALNALKKYLIPCVLLIQRADYEEAINYYKKMVNYFEGKYNIVSKVMDIDVNTIDIKELGKGRVLKVSE